MSDVHNKETVFEKEERFKAHLTALDAFIVSPAHAAYVAGKETERGLIESQILMGDVVDIPTLFEHLKLRGQLQVTLFDITQFETARTSLITQLEQIADEKQSMATEYKP